MVKKPAKRKSPTSQRWVRKKMEDSAGLSGWIWRIALSVVAGFFSYVLLPRLQFIGQVEYSTAMLFSLCISILVLGLSSPWTKKYTALLKLFLPVVFVLILITTMALQFKWVDSNIMFELPSIWFIIPVGILWASFLSRMQFVQEDNPEQEHTIRVFLRPQYLTALLIVAAIGATLLFYRLGYYDFWEDENLVINAAISLRDQGSDYLSEGYDRAWAHSWMIAQSIQLFGESEWSARLPSAVFGMLFILLSCFIFFKWFRLPWMAIFIPLICLLTDEFLILFRYARMYAPMIPFFLAAMYLTHRFLVSPLGPSTGEKSKFQLFGFNGGLALGSLSFLVAATHFHLLASIGFLAAYCLLLVLALTTRLKKYILFIGIFTALAAIAFALGLAEVPLFRLVPKAIKRLTRPDAPEYMYYQFIFNNGMPQNVTLMTLIGGAGLLLNNTWERRKKIILALLYITIAAALIFMVYLMADTGRDYRYISHIVPFVIGLQLVVLYQSATGMQAGKWTLLFLFVPLVFTLAEFSREYKEVYVRHPWSPLYSVVYADIRQQYKPGEAILYQNMKTYYLDPRTLAGDKAIKMGKRREMALKQFKAIFNSQAKGWIVFDTHKAYHVNQEIQKFIARRAEKRHGHGIDDTGVEVYYFNKEGGLTDD